MEWVNSLSTRPSLEAAISDVVDQALAALTQPPDVGLIFISSAFASDYPRVLPLLRERLPDLPLIGCGGGGVIGTPETGGESIETVEIEGDIGLSLTLAHLPGVKIQEFYLSLEDLPDLDSPPDRWVETLGVNPEEDPQLILLADPMMTGITDCLQGLDYAYPKAPKVGGLSSGAVLNGGSLFCGDSHPEPGSGRLGPIRQYPTRYDCGPGMSSYWETLSSGLGGTEYYYDSG